MGLFDKFRKRRNIKGDLNDVFLAHEILEAWGEESNFTLIAANVTKYYLELTRNYNDRFSNAASLLTTVGVLDAQTYVFVEKTIGLGDVISLAERSAQLGEQALLDFIVNLEILLFKIDSPEFDISEIEEACLAEEKAISKAIERTKKEYIGEPLFTEVVSKFMNLPQFKQIRQQIGIKN